VVLHEPGRLIGRAVASEKFAAIPRPGGVLAAKV
jgi:hypothetical protein